MVRFFSRRHAINISESFLLMLRWLFISARYAFLASCCVIVDVPLMASDLPVSFASTAPNILRKLNP